VCLVHFMLRVSWPQPAAVGTLIGLDQDLGGTSPPHHPVSAAWVRTHQLVQPPHQRLVAVPRHANVPLG
jgi:hypothetical protein